MMIILTLLSETSKRSFEIDRCNSEINREPIYTLFIFFFQFSCSKYNYSAAHLGSPRGTPVAEQWFISMLILEKKFWREAIACFTPLATPCL